MLFFARFEAVPFHIISNDDNRNDDYDNNNDNINDNNNSDNNDIIMIMIKY